MRAIQQDDIYDEQRAIKNQRYYYNNVIVKAKNKAEAVVLFKNYYGMTVDKEDLTNDKNKQILL